MSTAAYRDWVRKGRPWENCLPVRDFVVALQLAGWTQGSLGTIGDEAHLQAERPQDHTPFSVTGWPGEHPYPLILALDVMHSPAEGRDVAPLFDYWLYEARMGRQPWLKYMVWRAMRYDVRNNWNPVAASGHWDHAHLSFRTDHARAGLAGWRVTPNGGNDMTTEDRNMHVADTWRTLAILEGTDARYHLEGEPEPRHEVNQPAQDLKSILTGVQALLDRPPVTVSADAVAAILAASPDFISRLGAAIADNLGDVPSASDVVIAHAKALLKGAES